MDTRVYMIILVVVFLLLLVSLFILIKKFFHNTQSESAATNETKELSSEHSGKNLRENFRVPLEDVYCFVEFLDVENEELTPKFFNGTMKNISAGGVKVVCNHEYPILDDLKIKIRFTLRDSMFILKGKLLRKEIYPEKNKFGYGVQFTNLFDEERELLYQILNRIVIEKKREI